MWLLGECILLTFQAGSQALHSTSAEARATNTFLLFTYASHVSGRLLQDFTDESRRWVRIWDQHCLTANPFPPLHTGQLAGA